MENLSRRSANSSVSRKGKLFVERIPLANQQGDHSVRQNLVRMSVSSPAPVTQSEVRILSPRPNFVVSKLKGHSSEWPSIFSHTDSDTIGALFMSFRLEAPHVMTKLSTVQPLQVYFLPFRIGCPRN